MSGAADPREVVQKLQTKPGRGGIRLSYAEAQLLLRMVEHRATIVKRARARRGLR